VLFDDDSLRTESFPEYVDCSHGTGLSAKKNIESRIPILRPGVDADVRLSEEQHARDPSVGRESVKMRVQDRGSGDLCAMDQGRLDMLEIIDPFGFVKVDQQMNPGASDAVAFNEAPLGLGFRDVLGVAHGSSSRFSQLISATEMPDVSVALDRNCKDFRC
jgi:hypothetical protein